MHRLTRRFIANGPPHVTCERFLSSQLGPACTAPMTGRAQAKPGLSQECTRDCGNLLVRGTDPASEDGQRLVKASRALHKVGSLPTSLIAASRASWPPMLKSHSGNGVLDPRA